MYLPRHLAETDYVTFQGMADFGTKKYDPPLRVYDPPIGEVLSFK